MAFPVSAALLDALVLSVVSREDTYGYKITQEIREAMDMSESTLYPVLRRLLKNNFLESYDQEYMGRNRRYYKITDEGLKQLEDYQSEWFIYKEKIDKLMINSEDNRSENNE
ncbi:MAG: PadR family transcriptional regulator [Oscillospiraceae bacterium]|nr:PadR family transcriptional regulator [Oscillospiraceae bacterium]